MANEYIRKEDAIDAILRGGITYHEELVDIWEIERIPAADVAPVRHGYWIRHDTDHSMYYDCSICSCVAPCAETADKILWKLANYCPDCGAKMDGKGEE